MDRRTLVVALLFALPQLAHAHHGWGSYDLTDLCGWSARSKR